ncbi:GGDEF domain-containing protein [Actinoplanes couchii]|uniref:GGDEF domain-containing protein n=1 Tax=Actinoplanes couchii TaxID=403638 RepID=A0ABQ3XTK4_9ACTN|nr:GGDEF domain-containing protein [Actinoplanes couchii]MDR6318934.1 diguanylate cyclase (GGDEF)-like protein [Actinoplanes couchii]GID61842.1 hypothetical protein Aco03nite_102460 [Actinoplanes couchii]
MSILIAVTAIAVGTLIGRLTAHHRLHHLQTALRQAQQHADHDRLTGMLNRWAAATLVARTVETSRRPTTLALIDLDNFKTINDAYGYQAGDQLLRIAAARLTITALHHGGFTARLGGDEFLLVVPHTAGNPQTITTQALAALAQTARLATDDGPITVTPAGSAGLTTYDGTTPTTFTDLLHQADIALHHAKQHRGTHHTYQPGMSMPRNAGRHGPRRRDQHRTGQTPA